MFVRHPAFAWVGVVRIADIYALSFLHPVSSQGIGCPFRHVSLTCQWTVHLRPPWFRAMLFYHQSRLTRQVEAGPEECTFYTCKEKYHKLQVLSLFAHTFEFFIGFCFCLPIAVKMIYLRILGRGFFDRAARSSLSIIID